MVLLGASGCGKSTLLRIIAGLETATSGEVWIGGRRIDHLSPKDRGIAMVFQNYAVFPHLTVFENIGFGLRMQKLPNDEVKRRVERVAGLMHIEMLLKRYSGELSGGQRQRVAVARALAMEPDVILMDEPLSNLDALLRMEMRAELKGVLAESKTTAIYVTHDQVEAMSMADRISVMHEGNIVQAASPIEVYRNPAARFVASFIGNPPMNFLPATPAGSGQVEGGGPDVRRADRRQGRTAIRHPARRHAARRTGPRRHGQDRRTAGRASAGDLPDRRRAVPRHSGQRHCRETRPNPDPCPPTRPRALVRSRNHPCRRLRDPHDTADDRSGQGRDAQE